MKVWKILIRAAEKPCDRLFCFSYVGTATTAEIALRQVYRRAKKDGLWKIELESVEYIGLKEFGR